MSMSGTLDATIRVAVACGSRRPRPARATVHPNKECVRLSMKKVLISALALVALPLLVAQQPTAARQGQAEPAPATASILLYHRFGPVVHDEMTVRTATFRAQLDYLKQHGYPIVPLRTVVSHLLGKGPAPPPRSVVITVDDGHASVFTEMLPLVTEYRIPVTLFIYPSAISNASYAMKWDQLASLQRT